MQKNNNKKQLFVGVLTCLGCEKKTEIVLVLVFFKINFFVESHQYALAENFRIIWLNVGMF